MIQAMIGMLCGVGLFYVLADALRIPYMKTSRGVENIAKRKREKTGTLDVWLEGLAMWLARHLRLYEFRRSQLESDLKIARMDITPELYMANAIVKASLIGVLAIPIAFVFPLLCPVVLVLAIYQYRREYTAAGRRIKEKRRQIEYELPRLVFTVEKTLKHSRDVLYMLENYATHAGPALQSELNTTVADMKSGNYEVALTRLESRVGSSMMSDVCRGLISILRGDDTEAYWASLSLKFSDTQRQFLRLEAQKAPRKVKRLSMCLLICFMLIYIVVIVAQILDSVGVLFV